MGDVEDSVIGLTEDWDIDIKLNPDFYIHTAIVAAQKSILMSLSQGKTTEGIQAYSIFVKQIQMIADAVGYLDEETIDKINNLTDTDTITKAKNANLALGWMLRDIFGQKPQFASLDFNVKKINEVVDETGRIPDE